MGVTNMEKVVNIITSLISTPTVSVSNQFTALHLAAIAWDLYCESAPTHFAGEFSVSESSDFAHYNIGDAKDISNHFYECAFAIASRVESNPEYSVQDAYYMLDDISADTVVREDVSAMLYQAVNSYTHCSDEDSNISEDYAEIVEANSVHLPTAIAQAEAKLAELKAQVTIAQP